MIPSRNSSGNIFFIDEENSFIKTAKAVCGSDNYYVLITRENLYNLPYSVEEIYGLYASGKYQNTKRYINRCIRFIRILKKDNARNKS